MLNEAVPIANTNVKVAEEATEKIEEDESSPKANITVVKSSETPPWRRAAAAMQKSTTLVTPPLQTGKQRLRRHSSDQSKKEG